MFGTDDAAELEKIAETIRQKNPRNAGRKKKFSEEDILNMRASQAAGVTINEIARQYGTSRQVVSKYLGEKPHAGCTMRLTYMYRQRPCTVIDVDFLRKKVYIQNRTDDILHRAFGINEKPAWKDFELFLRERCFPETRGLLRKELERLGVDDYDPLQIAEKFSGRTAEDTMWLKFQYYRKEAQGRYAENQPG